MNDITGAARGTGASDHGVLDKASTGSGDVAAADREPEPEPGEAAAQRDAEAVSRFTEDFVFALIQMGFPRMPARVFAALITTDSGRLTAAELSEALQASAAGVSGAVRYLIQLGLVRLEGEPGSRRHYYRVRDNWWDDMLGVRNRLMGRWAAVMREGAGVLGSTTSAGARIAESARYFEFLSTELPQVMGRWRERKAELDGGVASDQ